MTQALPLLWLGLPVAGATALLAWIVHWALGRHFMDVPNARSSHETPTPRTGGLAIWAVFSAAVVLLAAGGGVPWTVAGAFLGAGAIAAGSGLVDDLRGASPATRLALHGLAAVWGLAFMGGVGALSLGPWHLEWGWIGEAVVLIGLVWMINLYNFMDGIHGLAASEAVFVAGAGAVLAGLSGDGVAVLLGVALAACALGFLPWNWPRAHFFMGNTGSYFLGVSLGLLAIVSIRADSATPWVWMILLGVFIADATATLLRRWAVGASLFNHRNHGFQILSRRWNSHARATAAVMGFNLCVLAPLAAWAWRWPDGAPVLAAAVLAGIAAGALALGAGRADTEATAQHTP